ncbi:hypothetical protein BDV28DRAFT_145955 [Aspergillus coremiiformis]|uniref:Histone h1.3 n=1 Tax=Aspergillus coremiiformis TaxID=138285 RepID=A0A5N6ZHQ3_9EURO|nr:hypothetical protein BDV28DRAFT_145955 [Aspergillus coremiiformis]
MSAKSKPEGVLGLTNSEQKVLLLGILCTDESNKLDYEKLATYGGYKNIASASTTYRSAKRKLQDCQPEPTPSAEASTTNTPKRGRPSKKSQAADPPVADPEPAEKAEEATPGTKTKRQRTTRKGIARKIKSDPYDTEDAVKSESSPSKTKAVIKEEEGSDVKEESSFKEESPVKKEEKSYDECKSEDENPMSNKELDAQLGGMETPAQSAVKVEIKDDV